MLRLGGVRPKQGVSPHSPEYTSGFKTPMYGTFRYC